ncbi:MAG: nucleotidyltransferase domain-containing protein [Anaerolineales bacterium]|nr:nucleotidyltransferase domain-containing protein [Anaerolineales bacterium]
MLTQHTLQQIVDRIVATSKPQRVIVFGSYGRGNANEGSDLDLMVIKTKVANKYDEMIRLHEEVGKVGVGVDILVYSEAEFNRRSQVPGTVLYWARKEGKALYKAALL